MSNGSQPKLLIPALNPIYTALNPLLDPLLRIITGLWLIPHGAQKLFGWNAGPNQPVGFDALSQAFEKYLHLPGVFGPLAALIEFVGGILLVLGLLTRPAATIVFVELLIAFITVHLPNGFFADAHGFEYVLMWTALAGVVAVRGGGRFSVDALIGREF